jgi:hypothetical protein
MNLLYKSLFAATLHANAVGLLALMVIVVGIAALWGILGHILGDNPRGAGGIILLIGLAIMISTTNGRAAIGDGISKVWSTIFG